MQPQPISSTIPRRAMLLAMAGCVVVACLGGAALYRQMHVGKLLVAAIEADTAQSLHASSALASLLQCRRHEQDALASIDQPVLRSRAIIAWCAAWMRLRSDFKLMVDSAAAESHQPYSQQLEFAAWQSTIEDHRVAFLDVVARIESGQITTARQAHLAMAGAGDLNTMIEQLQAHSDQEAMISHGGAMHLTNRLYMGRCLTTLAISFIILLIISLTSCFSGVVSRQVSQLEVAAVNQETLRKELESHNQQLEAVQRELADAIELEAERNRQLSEAQRASESASHSKSEFLANMSHEIRTPMTAILGYTDVLLETADRPEEVTALHTVKRNGEFLLNIINDILDLSKIEAGKMQIELMECSPAQIMAEVATLMRVPATAKGLWLEVALAGPIPTTMKTDPTRLRQILINLVGNAIKFTECGGIRVIAELLETEYQRPAVRFVVTDSGIGMTEDQMVRLFSPFTQADSSVGRRFGGTGLGLSICQRLAAMLGGEITVQSTMGEGSAFTVTILAEAIGVLRDHAVPFTSAPTLNTVAVEGDALLERRVLLAEDGPDNQRLISMLLRRAGATVTLAQNGQEALEAVNAGHGSNDFDLILMDMQMPIVDGYSAARKLREAGCDVPIIALTAHAMQGDREKCLAAGCSDYLTKPVDRQSLLAMAVKYLQPLPLSAGV